MKKAQVQIGETFIAKVSGKRTRVKIIREHFTGKGWDAMNLTTKRWIRIRTAARLNWNYLPKERSIFDQMSGLAEAARSTEELENEVIQ
jgi:hypothetical protein